MKNKISYRLSLTIFCMIVSMFFSGNVTVFAKEKATANTPAAFAVNYEGNGANGTAPSDSAKYRAGDSVVVMDAKELSKDGNKFAGWSKTTNSTTADYIPGDIIKITNGITLYAVWTDEQTTDTDVIISNSGTVRQTQMGAIGESCFPDRTFIAGN